MTFASMLYDRLIPLFWREVKPDGIAKLLASDAAWHAGEAALQTHGGYGFAREYDVERKWRETRLTQIAPISTNLILAFLGEHVLGMTRSY
jgi:acyl-CoA dehydrogenase